MDRPPGPDLDRDEALLALLALLRSRGYAFVTPTPRTHAIVLHQRRSSPARDIEDVLGWSMPFAAGSIDPDVTALLEAANVLDGPPASRKATIRVSRLGGELFIHSAFPTTAADAVFFGPDSYRFASLIEARARQAPRPAPIVIDIGTGAGVGAIAAARAFLRARVIGTDLNPLALDYAQLNARAAGVELTTRLGDTFAGYDGPVDVALANPPYILDEKGRLYRDGGALHGGELSIRMTAEALARLAPGGEFILYSGSAITRGRDRMRDAVEQLADEHGCSLDYRELDPDVFGEELETAAYAGVDRIAVVAGVFVKAG